jgi:hypothetical protein
VANRLIERSPGAFGKLALSAPSAKILGVNWPVVTTIKIALAQKLLGLATGAAASRATPMNARRNLCYDSLAYLMYLIRCPVNEIFATISHSNVEFPGEVITQRKSFLLKDELYNTT